MVAYTLKIRPSAIKDIQDGIDWYNSKSPSLGKRFHNAIKTHFEIILDKPIFQVRYDTIRCLPLKQFPYMIRFGVDNQKKEVIILGVINTFKNPKKWRRYQ